MKTIQVELSHRTARGWQFRFTHRGLTYRSFSFMLLIRMARDRGYTHYRLPTGDGEPTKIISERS